MADSADSFVASPATIVDASGRYSISGSPGTSTGTQFQFSSTAYFMVKTQKLDLEYCRVPQMWGTKHDTTLSSFTASGGMYGRGGVGYNTQLAVIVKAHTSVKKAYGTYSTSSYTQPQKFQILATSSDPQGRSYGSTTLTSNMLGPMGHVITKQNYYERRPWIEGKDAEYNDTVEGCNFAYYASGLGTASGWSPAINHLYDFDVHLASPTVPCSPLAGNIAGPRAERQTGNFYTIPGAYDLAKEVGQKIMIQNMLDMAGMNLGGPVIRGAFISSAPSSEYPTLTNEDYVFLPNYDYTLHDYT